MTPTTTIGVNQLELGALERAAQSLLPEVGTDPAVNRAYLALEKLSRALRRGAPTKVVVVVEMGLDTISDLHECLTRLPDHELTRLQDRLQQEILYAHEEEDETARAERRHRESVRQSRNFLFPR